MVSGRMRRFCPVGTFDHAAARTPEAFLNHGSEKWTAKQAQYYLDLTRHFSLCGSKTSAFISFFWTLSGVSRFPDPKSSLSLGKYRRNFFPNPEHSTEKRPGLTKKDYCAEGLRLLCRRIFLLKLSRYMFK